MKVLLPPHTFMDFFIFKLIQSSWEVLMLIVSWNAKLKFPFLIAASFTEYLSYTQYHKI